MIDSVTGQEINTKLFDPERFKKDIQKNLSDMKALGDCYKAVTDAMIENELITTYDNMARNQALRVNMGLEISTYA